MTDALIIDACRNNPFPGLVAASASAPAPETAGAEADPLSGATRAVQNNSAMTRSCTSLFWRKSNVAK